MKLTLLLISGCLMVCCIVCPAAFAQEDYSEEATSYEDYDSYEDYYYYTGGYKDYSKTKGEIFLGYSLMKVGLYDDVTEEMYLWPESKKHSLLKKGFATSFTYYFNSVLGIETSVRYNSGYILSEKWKENDENHEMGYKKSDFAFLFGPRLTFQAGRISPFVHGLIGISYDKLADSYDINWKDNEGKRDSWSDSETMNTHIALGIAVGGGLDIVASKNVAIRLIQGDYYLTNHPAQIYDYGSGNGNKQYKNINLSCGIVFRFGN